MEGVCKEKATSLFDSFYRLPRELFADEEYRNLRSDAKLLYTIILDRMCLSESNGWHDENGRVYQFFSQKDAAFLLGCSLNKACKLFGDLEKAGLIERRRQGLGKASVIYLKRAENRFKDSVIHNHRICESRIPDSGNQDSQKLGRNYTEYNQTEISYTESISIRDIDAQEIKDDVKNNIEYDILINRASRFRVDEIVDLITEVLCYREPIIRIGGKEQPRSLVHMRMLSLECDHIVYVLECIDKSSTKIRDIKAYLISALFNAPATMENYYMAEAGEYYD